MIDLIWFMVSVSLGVCIGLFGADRKVTDPVINTAIKACASNGGINHLTVGMDIAVICTNGATFKLKD